MTSRISLQVRLLWSEGASKTPEDKAFTAANLEPVDEEN